MSKQVKKYSSSSIGIVDPYVFAVGHNKNFIIVKQHPTKGFEGDYLINTRITNYYVIDMDGKATKEADGKIGPFTKNQFDSIRIQLHIENISFDQIYPENP